MSTLTVATVKSNSSSPPTFQNTSGTEIGRLCRAFVNFNGTGTVAINGSYNVSSITDNNVGDYTINFTNALADANYSAVMTIQDTGNGSTRCIAFISGSPATNYVRLIAAGSGSSLGFADPVFACAAIFR